VINSRRFQNYDRNFFRTGGIEPTERAVLAVKSSQHFRAAYAPIAAEVIVVDEGGGVMSNNLPKLPWTRVPRPIYPLDLDCRAVRAGAWLGGIAAADMMTSTPRRLVFASVLQLSSPFVRPNRVGLSTSAAALRGAD
jgi:hypothetical protein